jgi:Zn-dependent protease with chaperone function
LRAAKISAEIFGLFSERALHLLFLGSSVEVGPTQFPRLHALYGEVLDTLDAPDHYRLFVTQNPVVNAGAVGMDNPFIVLNSATIHLLDDDQLRVVLGHEVGHILSQHVLYKTMLRLLLRAGLYAFSLPLTGLALLAVLAALLEWDRKAELSSDRAAALVAQNPDHVRVALLRLAGGVGEGASVEAFRAQAARYEESGGAVDSVIKTLALLGRSHPFPVQRLKELDLWIASGDYQKIIDGDYPRREDDPKESPWGAWQAGAEHYAETLKTGTDPVVHWLKDVGESASEAASQAFGWFKRKRGGDEGPGETGG